MEDFFGDNNNARAAHQAREGYIAESEARKDAEVFEIANPRPVFTAMTPERLRQTANDIRKRQGLPPLP